jgi:hypothetical protein
LLTRTRRLAAITGLALAAGLPFIGSAEAANTTVVVTAADLGDDWHTADTRGTGTGSFENGPATPPLGVGSFELSTPDGTAKVQLFTDRYDGVRLADIDGIGYSSYQEMAPTPGVAMVALNMRIDLDGNGAPDAYMVYEPYQDHGNAAITPGVWQTWDAYRGGAAKWWVNTGVPGCGQSTPCTWSTIVGIAPNATIEEGTSCGNLTFPKPVCPGSLGFNQGSGNAGTRSNGDALYVSVSGNRTTFDFELVDPDPDNDGVNNPGDNCPTTPNSDQANNDGDTQGDACDPDDDNDTVADGADNCPTTASTNQADQDNDGLGDPCDPDDDGDNIPDTAPPTNADQCKKGGYASFNNPSFRNQGQCVSYVNARR